MYLLSNLNRKLLQIALSLLLATPCLGGENQWTLRQPSADTGQILGLTVDPQNPGTIFLATENGLFRSEDSGLNWEVVNPSPRGRQVLPHIAPPLTVLFALGGKGVLFSLTRGQGWVDPGIARHWIAESNETLLGVHSLPGKVGVYVATACCAGGPSFPPIDFRSWRSADSGETFIDVTDQVGFARSMAVDDSTSLTIYLASALGVFRSQDAGDSWQQAAGAGLPAGTEILALGADPRFTPARLVAGSASGRAFASDDRGESWFDAGTVPGAIRQLRVDPAVNRSIYYARSNDGLFANFGGTQWLPMRRGAGADDLTLLALSSTAQANPAALFGVTSANQVLHYQPQYRYLPQVGEGESGVSRFQTSLVTRNAGGQSFLHVEFFDPDGEELELELADFGPSSFISAVVERGESLDLEAVARPNLRIGYARLLAGASVGGTAVFTRSDVPSGQTLYEAGVPLTGAFSDFSVAVDSIGPRDSGVALVNASAQPAQIVARLYDQSFDLLSVEQLELPPNSQLARFVFELFPDVQQQAREMKGTLTIASDQPLAAVALRQNEDILDTFPSSVPTLTVFPVIAGRADQDQNP